MTHIVTSDQMTCVCGNVWDMNDGYPPKCGEPRAAFEKKHRVELRLKGLNEHEINKKFMLARGGWYLHPTVEAEYRDFLRKRHVKNLIGE